MIRVEYWTLPVGEKQTLTYASTHERGQIQVRQQQITQLTVGNVFLCTAFYSHLMDMNDNGTDMDGIYEGS